MDGWMDGAGLWGAAPWDTGTPALRADCTHQLGFLDSGRLLASLTCGISALVW